MIQHRVASFADLQFTFYKCLTVYIGVHKVEVGSTQKGISDATHLIIICYFLNLAYYWESIGTRLAKVIDPAVDQRLHKNAQLHTVALKLLTFETEYHTQEVKMLAPTQRSTI